MYSKYSTSLVLALILNFQMLAATVFTSNGTGGGDWTLASTWTRVSGDIATFPDEDDIVTILSNDNVIVSTLSTDNQERFENLTININGILTINNNCKVRGWGTTSRSDLIIDGSLAGSGRLISDLATYISGNGSIGSSIGITVYSNMYFENISIVIAGLVTIAGQLFIQPTADVEFTGNVYVTSTSKKLINKGTLRISGSNFLNDGRGNPQQVLYCDYSGSTFIYNQSGNLPLPVANQFVNLTNTAAINSSENFSIKGDWDNSVSFSSLTSGNEIIFNGSSNQEIKGGGTFNLQKLTFQNTSNSNKLTLSSNCDITINQVMESSSGIFEQNGANIILETSSSNDETGIVKVATASNYSYQSGDFTAKRFINGSANSWRMISSPILNSTLSTIDENFIFCGITDGAANNNYSALGCGNFYNVLTYDNSNLSWNNVTTINQSISGGTGTMIFAGPDPLTISITGAPTFANTPVSISNAGDAFNLVSNPYPTTIDWDLFKAANAGNINGSGYFIYDEGTGGFVSKTTDISSNQGFFVKATSSGNLNFNVNTTINDYDQPFQKSINGINNPLKVSLFSEVNTYHDYAYLISGPDFSSEYDFQNELEEFFPTNQTFDYAPSLFFVVDDTNQIDRNHINNNQNSDIFIDARIGKFAHGNYTLKFSDLPQFMIGSCIVLEDLHNGVITDLRLDSTYTFLTDSLAPYPRFKINISVDYNINVTNSSCFQNNSAVVTLTGNEISGNYFDLIDSNGIMVESLIAENNLIQFNNLNAGLYNFSTNHVGSCSVNSQEIIITQPDEVIASFISYMDTIFIDSNGISELNFFNQSTAAKYYNWDFGDGTYSEEKNPSHTYHSEGSYLVKLSADNDSIGVCTSIFTKYITVINPFLNIYKGLSNDDIIITHDNQYLTILFTSLDLIDSFNVLNISGKTVLKGKNLNINSKINISSLKCGVYIISFNDLLNRKITKKFIKY
jgi:PKD repeat protein